MGNLSEKQFIGRGGQTFTIRSGRPEDAAAILQFSRTVGGETENLTFDEAGIPVSEAAEREFLAVAAAAPRDIFLVAEENGEIIATASFSAFSRKRLAHRGTVALAVRKDFWGLGIGTALMGQLLRFAEHTARVMLVSLEVRSDNQRAIRLYESFGFQKIGCFKGFFLIDGELIDCDFMEKFLQN